MSRGRTWHWRVSGTAVRDGGTESVSLTVQTGEKDDSVAAQEFRHHARDIGYVDVTVKSVELLGQR